MDIKRGHQDGRRTLEEDPFSPLVPPQSSVLSQFESKQTRNRISSNPIGPSNGSLMDLITLASFYDLIFFAFSASRQSLYHLSQSPSKALASLNFLTSATHNAKQESHFRHLRHKNYHRKPWIRYGFTCSLFLVHLLLLVTFVAQILSHSVPPSNSTSCGDVLCIHGTCVDGRCQCDKGWQGSACHRCGGRIKLDTPHGLITDGMGNYSTDLQCTWLIDAGAQNATIRMEFNEFETECSWDHLYIFDGDSVFSPLIAAYSGLLIKDGYKHHQVPEIVAQSGRAYLYFYSDAAYNMSGFNLSYSVNWCPRNCSGRGVCVGGICTCYGGWMGDACDISICPNDCSSHGQCDKHQHRCVCDKGYAGVDCSQRELDGVWTTVPSGNSIEGRTLHASVLHGDNLYVIGGEMFHAPVQFLARFDLKLRKWEVIESPPNEEPQARFGHSAVIFQDKIYVYGGIFTNGSIGDDLWAFDLKKSRWDRIYPMYTQCFTPLCSPLAAAGHTATIVDSKMIIIFGYNPVYGYLNTVQEYNFVTRKWALVETRGALVKGGFGHSSIYDPVTKMIYVFGGYHSYGTDSVLVDLLYGYNPTHRSWMLLSPSKSPRYLHSSILMNGMMLVFGGNSHNATSDNIGEKCFSPQFLSYEIACDRWRILPDPTAPLILSGDPGRYGHTAQVYNNAMYIFGGFNGLMLNTLLKFTPGDCYHHTMQDECVKAKPGVRCVWNIEKNICQPFTQVKTSWNVGAGAPTYYSPCEENLVNYTDLCIRQTTCPSCLENSYGCVWCGDSCSYEKCRKSGVKGLSDSARCEDDVLTSNCDKLHNCHACHTEYHCGWQRDSKCYTYVRETGNKTEKAIIHDDFRPPCEVPCNLRTSCENCTQGQCMWCSSLRRCIESNAYAAMFPSGQCMEWTIHHWKCSALSCSEIQTCDRCQRNPRCGWCDDGSGTGVGVCLEGSATGAVVWNGTGYSPFPNACPRKHWFFSDCPECQCNGHSTCEKENNQCQKPCKHFTEGARCQHCIAGYYGNPLNGGNCTPCSCHGHSLFCNRETGKCYCSTKGITGHHCDRCDEQNHYFGDPTLPGPAGSCFYNLTIDFQYTFNMSKSDDRHYNRINFMNVPLKSDVDVDFTIQCSEQALVNISIGSGIFSDSLPTRSLHERLECGNFKLRFSHDEHLFGIENTTFYVNVFGFATPMVLQISFSQHRTLDLLQFFVTFSSCFLTLLIIAAILWKIKQKYDMYRRRQQLFVEMEQMASRPFAGVVLEVRPDPPVSEDDDAANLLLRDTNPTPIALEPCSNGKAAVLSLLIRLPCGSIGSTPPGQTGLAIASALVSLGSLDMKENNTRESRSQAKDLPKLPNSPSTATGM